MMRKDKDYLGIIIDGKWLRPVGGINLVHT